MRISGVFRVALLAAAAVTALAAPMSAEQAAARGLATRGYDPRHVEAVKAAMVEPVHMERVLAHKETEPTEAEEEEVEEAAEEEEEEETAEAPAPAHKKKHKKKKATEAPETEAPATETEAPVTETEETAETTETAEETPAPTAHKKKHKKKKATEAPATEAPAEEEEEEEEEETTTPTPTKGVNDQKIKGTSNEGVIDGSSEGSAEIDKIDLRNQDGWVSVYDDPPLLVVKASLYAFISYNDTEVCDSFNMTMNAVEQKPDGNGTFSYHVVAYINCTKDGEDETKGRFILNFIPEGKRLLLTECGHREEGEIVNWLRIQEEVPECMTPAQRKKFLAQPMKHIHASNGTATETDATQTDFFSKLEDLDGKEVAIAGSATVALIAVIVVLVVFVLRKRKAQKDLERTIAGAKAEHAVEDDDVQTEEEKKTKERKGLMDSSKAKPDEADMEEGEGSFVNSPAVRV